jgi:hypothetical protein
MFNLADSFYIKTTDISNEFLEMSTPKIIKPALTAQALKNRQDFILWVTDFFHGHWEDPSWGTKQVAIYEELIKMAKEKAAATK